MKNNAGITLINMFIIVIVLLIISGLTIFGGSKILKNAKESQRAENLSAVKSAVYNISTKLNVAGVLTPANTKKYGKLATSVYSGDSNLEGWYILEKDDLYEMGISYVDEDYLVNYEENRVIPLSEYNK